MNRRQLVVIGALVAGAFLLYLPRLLSDGEGESSVDTTDAFVFSVADPITRVDIADLSAGRTIRLERGAPDWTVDGLRMEMNRIETLLPTLERLESEFIVARNPSNHEALGVSGTAGRRVDVYTEGGGPYSFHLGNRDLAAGGYYVRLPNSDRVYRLDGPVGGYLSRERDGWRNRVIARVDAESVRDVVIRRQGDELVIRRQGGEWSVDGQPIDPTTMDEMLTLLGALSTSDFASDEDAAAADFSTPDVELDVFAEGGGDVTGRELVLGLRFVLDVEEGDWLTRTVDGREVYRLLPHLARRLIPERDELAPE